MSDPGDTLRTGRGIRMHAARPGRIAAGLAIVFAAGLGLFAIAVDAGRRDAVVMVTRHVDAGQQLTAADLTSVEFGSDDAIATVSASQITTLVGQYAKFDLAPGSLLAPMSLQERPLVSDDHVLVAVSLEPGEVPTGLTVGGSVVLVVTTDMACPPTIVNGIVIAAPAPGIEAGGDLSRDVSLSVEVPLDQVAIVVTAVDVVIATPNTPEPSAPDSIVVESIPGGSLTDDSGPGDSAVGDECAAGDQQAAVEPADAAPGGVATPGDPAGIEPGSGTPPTTGVVIPGGEALSVTTAPATTTTTVAA